MAADVLAPEDIDDLTAASGSRGGVLNLFWSAPADDQNGGDIINGWYRIDFSSDPAHVFAPETFKLQFSTSTTAGQPQSFPLGSLLGNATYYARVVAADDVPNWAGLSNGATAMTPAYAPSGAGHGANTADSIAWSWSTGTNKSGTEYLAQDESGESGWVADALGWASGGRSANTLYHLAVKARNAVLLESASASTQAYTAIETPAVLTFPSVSASSITIRIQPTPSNLTAGDSGAFFTNVTLGTDSGWVHGSSWPATGLAPNTQYVFTAKARNGDKDETPQSAQVFRVSGIEPPADGDMSVTFLSTADISLSLTPAPNPVYLQTGSEFENVEGGAVGGGGSGRLTGVYAHTDHDLLANTRYGYRAEYYNAEGLASGFGPTRTLYTQIETPFLVFDSVGPNYISARALGTLSNLDAGLSGLRILNLTRSASSGWIRTRTWTSADLSSNTAYSFVTQARNADGVDTPQSGILVRVTLLEPPPASTLSLTDRTSAQMTVSAAVPPNPILGQTGCEFELVEGPGGDGSGRLSGTYGYVDGGLSANTRYGYRARYFNAEGVATAYGGTLYGYTLSAQPLAAAYSDGGDFQMRANWEANGNAAGTEYVVELSTDAFATLTASSSTANTQVLFTGLEGNTVYSARVQALNAEGIPTGYTLLGSTKTWSTTPRDPRHSGQTQTEVSWAWTWGADHTVANEFYASDESGASGWVAGAAAWTSGGKAANTLYHMSVKARDPEGVESAVVSTTAYTAIESATGVGVDAAWASSVTVRALGTISNVGSGASAVLLNNAAGGDSGWGGNAAWTSVGLSSNTVYTFRARTRNGDGDEPGPGVAMAAYSGLNAPLADEITAAAVSSVTLAVSVRPPPNGAAGQTGCEFEVVEGPGGTGSGRLTGAYSYEDNGLTRNTRYGYRARYFNAEDRATGTSGVKYRYTLAAEPAAAAYSGVTETALQANWGANGNSAGTEYVVELSTDAFATLVAWSRTADTQALFTGLKPDTSYSGRVKALNAEDAVTAWKTLGDVRTLANAPRSPGHSGQTQTAISWTWSWGLDDPPGTEYYAWDETGASGWVADAAAWTSGGKAANTLYHMSVKSRNGAGVESGVVSTAAYTAIEAAAGLGVDAAWASSVTVRALGTISNVGSGASAVLLNNAAGGDSGWGGNAAWTSVGLSSNTAYTFRARTRNGDGDEPGPGVVMTAYAGLNAPLADEITAAAVSSVTLAVSVRPPPNGAAGQTGCEFEVVEGPGGTGSGRLTGAYAYADEGLTRNTRYGYRVRYFNAEDRATGTSGVKYRYTLAAEPAAAAYSGVTETALQANWGANGNSVGTEYVVELSTDAFATLVAWSRTADTQALFSGLKPDTSYSGRVKALNAEDAVTAWKTLGDARTLANPPRSPGHSGQTQTAISWTWSWGLDDPPGTEYYAWDETGASGWLPGGTAWTSGGKAPNILQHMSVRARNQEGVASAAVSTAAYTAIESAAGVSVDAAYPSSMTVRALGTISNLGDGASAVLLGNEAGGDSGWGGNVPWTSVGLSSNTAYTFRARTRNGDGDEPGPGVTATAYTTLNVPQAGAITLVAESSAVMRVSVRLPPNSGAGQTGCEFEITEGPGGTGSGRLTGAYAYSDAGLSMNTRYGYRVRYFNADGLATEYGSARTAYTLAAEPSAGAYTGVAETVLQANWGANGNPDGTRYGVQVSSNDFSSVAATSVTANRFTLFSGLRPDTSYAGRVTSLNAEGMPSAWIALGSTRTYANPPLSPAVAVAGGPALTLAWQANSNPLWTVYEAQVSTSADFYPVHASSQAAALSVRVSGLDHSTTYYARVRAWGQNGAASAFVSAGSTVTAADAVPPEAITDLQAWTGGIEGRIRLAWTTPKDPATGLGPSAYFVRYSPAPILDWPGFDAASFYAQSWVPGAPGTREDRMLEGFAPGTTYYIAVVSEDESFNRSGLPNGASAWAQWDVTPPAQVLDLQVVSVSSSSALLRWTAPGDDAALGQADRYELRMSPLGPLDTLERFLSAKSTTVPAPSLAGQPDQSLVAGLAEATTYYFALRAADDRSNWSAVSGTVWTLTQNKEPPAAPRWAVPASSAAHGSVTLYWLANSEDDLAGYRLWRAASSGGPYAQVLAVARGVSQAADTGLAAGASVYYALTAFDSAGLESPSSAELEVYVPDVRAPGAVPGLKGLLGDDGRYSLQWSAVENDADGSPLADLAGYRVYRAAGRDGPYALQAALPAGTLAWTEPAALGAGYFLVRALDLQGNEGQESHICAPDLALSAASADGAALARMPASVAEPLYRATNGLGEDVRVTVERRSAEEGGKTLLSYEFTPLKAGTLQPAGDSFSFPKPKVEMTFKVPGGGSAAVYRYDGAEWVRLGGELDSATGMITVQTAKLGRFQVRQAARAESFSILQMTPRKIFTPNGDGINDVIEFFFENDTDWVVSEAKVYDLSGSEVSDMRVGSTGSSYVWDGKDKSGKTVRGGIYIYQFQSGGKTLNGTIVVAK